jgi:2'-hydroxyisoflavone reductase
MRMLILGGTRFVGYFVAEQALRAGWDVTVFNRGLAGQPPVGAGVIEGDRTAPTDIARLAMAGEWDAVVDCSGYVPANVLAVAEALAPVTDAYLFMSTVSVYRDWPVASLDDSSPTLFAPPDAGPNYGEDVEDGPTRYGYQKAGAEAAVRAVFGVERTTILRPGVVLGPREYVGRLLWWLNRTARGGRIVVPAPPSRLIQPIDVRDLALFAIHCISTKLTGTYNVTAEHAETFGDLMAHCANATGSDAEFVWTPSDLLLRAGVRQWSELPLWRTHSGTWQVSSSRASGAGLTCRPLCETVQDTWSWMQTSTALAADERATEIGLSTAKEQDILRQLRLTG